MTQPRETFQYYLVETGRCISAVTDIITEASISLTVNGQLWLSFMCTPTDLEAMAIGFLYNEGLIQSNDEIASVRLCPKGDNVDVWLNHDAKKPEIWGRTSGCTGGVTAVPNPNTPVDPRSLENHLTRPEQGSDGVTLTPKQISNLVGRLFESQNLYQKSGGVHTSVLSDGQDIHIVAEDIGRHNTLDKIAGIILLEGINLSKRILITTGRISSEMLQKSSRLGTSVVISYTSPSSLSIQMAEKQGITLIGYARRTSFRVYTHLDRIQLPHSVQKV